MGTLRLAVAAELELLKWAIGGIGILTFAETLALIFWLPAYYRFGVELSSIEIVGTLGPHRDLSSVTACSNSGLNFYQRGELESHFRRPLISLRPSSSCFGRITVNNDRIQIRRLSMWSPIILAVVLLFVSARIAFGGEWLILIPWSLMGPIWYLDNRTSQDQVNDLVDELRANLEQPPSPFRQPRFVNCNR